MPLVLMTYILQANSAYFLWEKASFKLEKEAGPAVSPGTSRLLNA